MFCLCQNITQKYDRRTDIQNCRNIYRAPQQHKLRKQGDRGIIQTHCEANCLLFIRKHPAMTTGVVVKAGDLLRCTARHYIQSEKCQLLSGSWIMKQHRQRPAPRTASLLALTGMKLLRELKRTN